MYAAVDSLGLHGIEPYLIRVEVDSRKALPGFDIVGLPDTTVKESRDRVKSAVQNLGYPFPNAKITANLAPADTKKIGSVYDLPILLSLIVACGLERLDFSGTAVIGEIGLSGEIRGVSGVLPMVLDAHKLGVSKVIVPKANAVEAGGAEGVDILCAGHVKEVIDYFKGLGDLQWVSEIPRPAAARKAFLDLTDVKGQREAKRAMEVAAAGGHNLLFIGPPGTGKSMLAKRIPSILPGMTRDEAVETTKIYSVAGFLENGGALADTRPFRSPHHTVSPAALTGGGPSPKPGEVSLAHNGILFLDEMPEFDKSALEVLRQPLEDGVVHISRVRHRLSYPARVMLVAAMNPCPCGFYGHPTKNCTCSPAIIQRYLGRVSGPMLDRVDIQIEVPPVNYEQISSTQKEERSAAVRERVEKARNIQIMRYKDVAINCNASIPPALLSDICCMEGGAAALLKMSFDRLSLSARAYDRILKVARTIADLEECEAIKTAHISEAIQYRSLDRKYWAGV